MTREKRILICKGQMSYSSLGEGIDCPHWSIQLLPLSLKSHYSKFPYITAWLFPSTFFPSNLLLVPTAPLNKLQVTHWNLRSSGRLRRKISSYRRFGATCGSHLQWSSSLQPSIYAAQHPSTMSTGYFPGVKRPKCGAEHPPPSKRRGHKRVGLYLYSTSGPQWTVTGRTFTF